MKSVCSIIFSFLICEVFARHYYRDDHYHKHYRRYRCPVGEFYSSCSRPDKTCENYYLENENYRENCIRGCFCFEGFVRNDDGDCIDHEDCENNEETTTSNFITITTENSSKTLETSTSSTIQSATQVSSTSTSPNTQSSYVNFTTQQPQTSPIIPTTLQPNIKECKDFCSKWYPTFMQFCLDECHRKNETKSSTFVISPSTQVSTVLPLTTEATTQTSTVITSATQTSIVISNSTETSIGFCKSEWDFEKCKKCTNFCRISQNFTQNCFNGCNVK